MPFNKKFLYFLCVSLPLVLMAPALIYGDAFFFMQLSDDDSFCQFVLDPASFNLKQRIRMDDLVLGSLFELSRDYCYAVHATRQKIMGSLQRIKEV